MAVAVALAAVNMLAARAAVRLDVTAEQLSSVSDETRQLLDALPEDRPVFIQAFLSPVVPELFVQARSNLIRTLEEIDALAGPRVEVLIEETEPFSDAAIRAREKFRHRPPPDARCGRRPFRDRRRLHGGGVHVRGRAAGHPVLRSGAAHRVRGRAHHPGGGGRRAPARRGGRHDGEDLRGPEPGGQPAVAAVVGGERAAEAVRGGRGQRGVPDPAGHRRDRGRTAVVDADRPDDPRRRVHPPGAGRR